MRPQQGGNLICFCDIITFVNGTQLEQRSSSRYVGTLGLYYTVIDFVWKPSVHQPPFNGLEIEISKTVMLCVPGTWF